MKKVMVIGIFDLITAGHMDFLKKARRLGDHLTLVLGNDDRTIYLKGNKRPVLPLWHRMAVLEKIEMVDAIYIPTTPGSINPMDIALNIIKPDIYAVDTNKDSGDFPKEKKICKELGIKIVHLPRWEPKTSVSAIIKQIKDDN